jgi:hypothetical protein
VPKLDSLIDEEPSISDQLAFQESPNDNVGRVGRWDLLGKGRDVFDALLFKTAPKGARGALKGFQPDFAPSRCIVLGQPPELN